MNFLMGALCGLTVNVAVTAMGMSLLTLSWIAAKMLGVGAAFFLNFWIHSNVVFQGGGRAVRSPSNDTGHIKFFSRTRAQYRG